MQCPVAAAGRRTTVSKYGRGEAVSKRGWALATLETNDLRREPSRTKRQELLAKMQARSNQPQKEEQQ